MATAANIVVTQSTIDALRGISAYRYLSVNQVATGVRGYGKTPKVYYLTKSGHRILSDECEHLGIDVEPYRQVNINSRWSPMMYHRLATLDVMMAVERDAANLNAYQLVKTLVEYRREKVGV